MSKKYTYEYVKGQIEKEGYKLLSKEYKNNKTPLNVLCPLGHEWNIRFNKWIKNVRCYYCSKISNHTYEYVKEQIEKEGYKLLSKTYKNNKTPLNVLCPLGHAYQIRFDNWQNGYCRCRYCKNNKHHYIDVKGQIEKEGYKLLSKEYINDKSKIKVKCTRGHLYEVSYSCWKIGNRCFECSVINKRNSFDKVKEVVESFGNKFVSGKYKNNNSKLEMECKNGHRWKARYCNLSKGSGCPYCSYYMSESKLEVEVADFIKSITKEVIIRNDRTQIINPLTDYNLELDIWIPSLKKAIEVNGVYFHSDKKTIGRDKCKIKQCKEKGIKLYVLLDKEWYKDKETCKHLLREFIEI